MKNKKILIAFLLIFIVFASMPTVLATDADYYVDLSELTYQASGGSATVITVYDDFNTFEDDYNNGNLPEIYITTFLYDGVGQAKKISLDDSTGDVTTSTILTTVININCTGNIEFTGTATDTMIAVNTNGVTGSITLTLNGINLTSSSSTPAIMVYNTDITYSDCTVTISTVTGTSNYITGGKLKKVSTMVTDNVDEYTKISSIYSDTSSEYYYVFTSSEVSNLLYAQETADNEKISEGSPYTYYKYSGAISSDIDLNFEGEGYLEVASQSDEGIEGKGDINFIGGTGDYKITAYDDGINASTTGTDILINVNSMYVSVNSDGDEGDAIDSNGTIHIEGGTIYAFAHATSQDDGLDSDQGTYINGGTVIATGNMADSVSNSSSQEFIKLNFAEQQSAGTIVYITDTSGNIVMAFQSDRTFTTLTYGSAGLEQTTYYVYKNGTIEGTSENGLYTSITSYGSGTQQQWTSSTSFTLTSSRHTFSNVTDYASSTSSSGTSSSTEDDDDDEEEDENNTTNSTSTNDTDDEDENTDNTTASGTLPQTGTIGVLKVIIFALVITFVVCYQKYKSSKF